MYICVYAIIYIEMVIFSYALNADRTLLHDCVNAIDTYHHFALL